MVVFFLVWANAADYFIFPCEKYSRRVLLALCCLWLIDDYLKCVVNAKSKEVSRKEANISFFELGEGSRQVHHLFVYGSFLMGPRFLLVFPCRTGVIAAVD